MLARLAGGGTVIEGGQLAFRASLKQPPAAQLRGDNMTMMQCEYRDHVITAEVMEHPGTPTPWAGGCRISNPQGQVSRRMALPVGHAFMAELEQAQRASIAHGKWLVDQYLDQGKQLFNKAA